MHTIKDRGFDRPAEHRFCFKADVGAYVTGDVAETDKGALLVHHVGRPWPNERAVYYYVTLDAAAIGAPVDTLTPEQAEARAYAAGRQKEGYAKWLEACKAGHAAKKAARDAETRAGVLEALRRDGWASAQNVGGSEPSRRRVFRSLVAEGLVALKRYKYVLKAGATLPDASAVWETQAPAPAPIWPPPTPVPPFHEIEAAVATPAQLERGLTLIEKERPETYMAVSRVLQADGCPRWCVARVTAGLFAMGLAVCNVDA